VKTKGRTVFVVLTVAVLLAVTYFAGSRLSAVYRTPLSACVEDSGTGGGLAVVRFAERLGYQVVPVREPVWQGVSSLPASEGVCLVTAGAAKWQPPDPHTGEAAWARLKSWVERGNSLVVLAVNADGLPPFLFDDAEQEPAVANERVAFFYAVSVPDESATEPQTTVVPTPYGPLTVLKDGPRLQTEPADGQLFGDADGTVLLRVSVGRGRVLVLLDDFAWVNAGLDWGENAAALAAVLHENATSGLVAVDEYRHGHGRTDSFVTFGLSLPGATSFLSIALIWTLLYVWAGNWRFGPPEPYEQPERRTAMEYIESVAELYRRAQAAPLAVAAVANRLRLLSRQRGHEAEDVAERLAEADRYVQSGERPAQPTAACRLVRELIQLRKQRYGH